MLSVKVFLKLLSVAFINGAGFWLAVMFSVGINKRITDNPYDVGTLGFLLLGILAIGFIIIGLIAANREFQKPLKTE